MANITRPPFWVPRPPDDYIWQMPTQWMNAWALERSVFQKKFFGAPGQVPTKNWASYFWDDPSPVWEFNLNWLNSAILQATTVQRIYGTDGQVPTKNWSPLIQWDDQSPVWEFNLNWLNSAILQMTTSQHFFGAGGQVPTKNWAFPFSYDDPPMWQGAPVGSLSLRIAITTKFPTKNWSPIIQWDDPSPVWQPDLSWLNSAILQMTTSQHFFGAGGQVPTKNWSPLIQYDDWSPVWQYTYQRANASLLATPFIPGVWRFNYDETPPWQFAYGRNNSGLLVISANNPFKPVVWRFNYDETPPWAAAPTASNTNFLPGIQFVPRSPFWMNRPGFDTEWYGESTGITTIRMPVITTKPFVPYFWNFNNDDPPTWDFWRPYVINDTLTLSSFHLYSPRSNWQYYQTPQDDPPVWNWRPIRNAPLLPTTVPPVNVLNVYRWWFNYDDSSFWQGAPVGSNIHFLPPTVLPGVNVLNIYRWWFNYDDSSFWQGAPTASNANLLPPGPLYVPRSPFWAVRPGEEQYWNPGPRAVGTLILPPPPAVQNPFTPRFWRYNNDDSAIWDFWRPYATNDTLTLSSFHLYSPRSNWQYYQTPQDDPPVWNWQPQGVGLVRFPTLPPVNVKNIYRWGIFLSYDVMGEPLWQGKPTPGYNLKIPTPPPSTSIFPEWLIRARRRGRR